MAYISPDNEYPRYLGDIQLAHPNWKLGDELPEGWVEVAEAPFPTAPEGQIVEEEFPTVIDGVMTQNWVVREMTAEEEERINAPKRAKQKLLDLGLTEIEIEALLVGMGR